jgi:hypothetical protein
MMDLVGQALSPANGRYRVGRRKRLPHNSCRRSLEGIANG